MTKFSINTVVFTAGPSQALSVESPTGLTTTLKEPRHFPRQECTQEHSHHVLRSY